MAYRQNTLNIQTPSYNASTNTPPLSVMNDGGIYEVATAGKVSGVTVNGAQVGANSYLLVGDKVVRKNGSYELLSREVKDNTNITVGTGGLFADFYTANEYTKQRIYSNLSLTLLSATVEIQSVDVTNSCGGKLSIYGAGFTIDFSGTVGTNCTLSGNNIYIDNFKVKANQVVNPVLLVNGHVKHNNGLTVNNTANSGTAAFLVRDGAFTTTAATHGLVTTTGHVTVTSATNGGNAFHNYRSKFSCQNLTATGNIDMGRVGDNEVAGNIVTNGGNFGAGAASTKNLIRGSINTSGGSFSAGNSCSNNFSGAITTGGGAVNCGNTCSNYFFGAITTTNGTFDCGNNTTNYFTGLVSVGTALFSFGIETLNIFGGGVTGTGGVNALLGSKNNCGLAAMPAGTPASGTNTASFSRVN